MQWYLPQGPEDFPDLGTQIVEASNRAIEWLVVNYGWLTDALNDAILQPLLLVERIMTTPPPWVIILAVAIIAALATRRVALTIVIVGITYLLGALGFWEEAMKTVSIMIISVVFAILVGIPIGVLSARSNWFKAVLTPVLDLMQTIPSFVYLIPIAMLFGLGKVPAIIATVVYATPPVVRLTDLGIREVSREVSEAARAFGATRWQLLRGVQMPLALPTILQGINQTTMAALAMVVIASLIGERGLGEVVLVGLRRNEFGQGLIGGIGIVALAIIFDRITQAAGRRAQAYRRVGN